MLQVQVGVLQVSAELYGCASLCGLFLGQLQPGILISVGLSLSALDAEGSAHGSGTGW